MSWSGCIRRVVLQVVNTERMVIMDRIGTAVRDLDVLLLITSEITEFSVAEDPHAVVTHDTEKAFCFINTWDHKEHWVPKSVARLGSDGKLWVKTWFLNKELR
jgi:hypothetical protein